VAKLDDPALKSAFERYVRVYAKQLAAFELLEADGRTRRRLRAGRRVNQADAAAEQEGSRLTQALQRRLNTPDAQTILYE
jgi:hypothetical protein